MNDAPPPIPTPLPSNGTVYDLQAIASSYNGFECSVTDGHYIYFLQHMGSLLLRVPLNDFTKVTSLDLSKADPTLVNMLSMVTDGRYAYMIPHVGGTKAARVDLTNFTPAGVTTVDTSGSNPTLTGGNCCAYDGQYLYYVAFAGSKLPLTTPTLLRIDTANFTTSGVSSFPLPMAVGFGEAIVFDDTYLYYVSYTSFGPNFGGTPFTRQITRLNRATFTYVDNIKLTESSPLAYLSTSGVAFFDGRYIWLSPDNGLPLRRIDTFHWPSMDTLDVSARDPLLSAFAGGFLHGRYVYFGAAINPKLVRFDTVNFGTYQSLDLSKTDGAGVIYNGICFVGGALYLNGYRVAATRVGSGKIFRLQLDNLGYGS